MWQASQTELSCSLQSQALKPQMQLSEAHAKHPTLKDAVLHNDFTHMRVSRGSSRCSAIVWARNHSRAKGG